MKTTSCFDVYELVFLQLSHCLQLVLTTNCMQKQQIPLMCICSNEFYYLMFYSEIYKCSLEHESDGQMEMVYVGKVSTEGGGSNHCQGLTQCK